MPSNKTQRQDAAGGKRNMWTRKQIKEKAKKAFQLNYWKCVLCGLIFAIIVGGASGAGGAASGGSSTFSSLMYNNQHREETETVEEVEVEGIDENSDPVTVTVVTSDDNGNEIDVNETDVAFGIAIFSIVALTVFAIVLVASAVGIAVDVLLINPVEFGCRNFFRRNLDEPAKLSSLTFAFDKNYKNAVKTAFFKDLFIWLWSLLFVIPGIIKAYEYRLVPYIFAENPDMKYSDILAESSKLMKGNKWKTFVLDLSFIGWELLSLCTCGLLSVFYVDPYKLQTDAALYEAIKYGDKKEIATV
jgi:uncharacterized membrane protein